VSLTGAHRNDVTQLMPLIEAIPPVRGRRGRPRQRPERTYDDRGYDYDKYRTKVRDKGITPVIRGSAKSCWAEDWQHAGVSGPRSACSHTCRARQ
jgi:hypothetical protein